MELAIAAGSAEVDRWAIDDYSIRAIVAGLVVVVGLPNELAVGMIVGTMVRVDAKAVAFEHGIVGNWYNVDDDSSVGLVQLRVHLLLLKRTLYLNDAMELEWVSVVVHGI